MEIASMLGVLFRKRKLRRELEELRSAVEAKRAEMVATEREQRIAWGKKWAYIHMQRRKQRAGNNGSPNAGEADGQTEVFEVRRQQCLVQLKALGQELEELLAKERQLAAESGEEPTAIVREVQGEGH